MPTGFIESIVYFISAALIGITGDLFGIELLVVLFALGLARYWKAFPDSGFARIEETAAGLAEHRWLAVTAVSVAAILTRLALLPLFPVPHPYLGDEFSHLFLADTLLQGRFANPAHPLWKSFETLHILQQPTYSSMYLPGPALFLAAGKLVFGHHWAGLLISMGAMCGLICWALQGWMPARWALLGASFAVLRYGLVSYWINSYWGGVTGALGGTLVLGALPRLQRKPQVRMALLLGGGLVLLASTRPFEGLVLAVPVAVRLGFWMFGPGKPPLRVSLSRVAVPILLCLVAGAAFLSFFFFRVTGSPTTLPYVVSQQTYGWPMTLPWTPLKYVYHESRDFRDYFQYELTERLSHVSPLLFLVRNAFKAQYTWRFYLGPALTIPLLLFPWWIRHRRIRFLLLTGGVVLFVTALIPNFPHYLSPMTLIFIAVAVQGTRHLRHYKRDGIPVGRRFTQLIPLVLAFCILCRVGLAAFDIKPAFYWAYCSWCCSSDGKVDQASIERQLPAAGRHLILVRYGPQHFFVNQWVYNPPNIDEARVVWARELTGDADRKLTDYFHNRRVWLFEPDHSPPLLRPYHPEALPHNAQEWDRFARAPLAE